MRRRGWLLHLRLLPGGDADLWSALAVSGGLALCLGLVGTLIGAVLRSSLQGELGLLSIFSAGTGLPAAVLLGWTGLRVARSKPLAADEAAVDVRHKRVWFPHDAIRVPSASVLVPLRPRQAQVQLWDGRWMRLFFRANDVPADLLQLAGRLDQAGDELSLETWVEAQAREFVRETLPDPEAIHEGLRAQLLAAGVVLTRGELIPAAAT